MAGKSKQITWTTGDIPDQSGRIAVVTGATGGLGFQTALALAGAGATVIIAARDARKGDVAAGRIRNAHPQAVIRFEELDLASLASVSRFASLLSNRYERVDLLVNNAGVMAPPNRRTTADGFELQFACNYLGHFALTARLLPSLQRGSRPRVVSVSSVVHKAGKIDLGDLQWERRRYSPTRSYHDSKLEILLFAFELQRRSDANGWGLRSVAAHPGLARTDLMANGPGLNNLRGKVFVNLIQPLLSHSAADGALSLLFAATSSEAEGGGYYGPSRRFELVGPPTKARVADRACDTEVARRLWDISESLADVGFSQLSLKRER